MYFFKLIRPLNLSIIALTMYGLGVFFETIYSKNELFGAESLPFRLLIFSTILIAAGGNIINDYFDIKADRVNKPERQIIGVHIKRRSAIVYHWVINFVAFSIAIYLSWVMESFLYLFIHLLSINVLWYYSMKGKRQFLFGNILIAALTALVPVLVGFYFHQVYANEFPQMDQFSFLLNSEIHYTYYLTIGLGSFAFILNLAREIVKDMEDVEGDKKLPAKTLPIILGLQKSKYISAAILSGVSICTLYIWLTTNNLTAMEIFPVLISLLIVVLCIVFLILSKSKKDFKRINALIKIAMAFGLLTPIYWTILLHYA